MILSVSRRTDVPNYYAKWFINRVREGFLYVRNPMNAHQISKINISPEVIDCIVFWTKNPQPLMKYLSDLKEYHYYFQFTLTGYGKDVEENVPHKKDIMIPVFQELSKEIGSNKVIWRYDPILFNEVYTKEYHLRAFEQIAEKLRGFTRKCIISFIDEYAKNRKNMERLKIEQFAKEELIEFVQKLNLIAFENGIKVASCAEEIDLEDYGIEHSCCVDRKLIEEIIGCKLKVSKDKNQRKECRCVESIEVGTYNTCRNGCQYCYANYSRKSVQDNCRKYDPTSPLLCGMLNEGDKITERVVKSLKEVQLSMWDS